MSSAAAAGAPSSRSGLVEYGEAPAGDVEPIRRALPKSTSRGRPSPSSMTLADLMSPCAQPDSCRTVSASATASRRRAISVQARPRKRPISPPGRYSKTSNARSPSVALATGASKAACCTPVPSRTNPPGSPGARKRTTTSQPAVVSRASQVVGSCPAASGRASWYRAATTCPLASAVVFSMPGLSACRPPAWRSPQSWPAGPSRFRTARAAGDAIPRTAARRNP